MGNELSNIWNAFIRGQIIVVIITIIIYTIFLGSMGVEFFFGLACIAALGRFVPYIGAWVTWVTYGLVALLQNQTAFNLSNGVYALLILGVAIVIDSIIDNFLVPKVMSENLKVHPALVLVGALIAVNLLGIVGILLAAPVLATLKLLLDYILHKLADENPWEKLDNEPPPEKAKWVIWIEQKWQDVINWFETLKKKKKEGINPETSPEEDHEDLSEP
jgi:predicted PurR-regulated permease PerM